MTTAPAQYPDLSTTLRKRTLNPVTPPGHQAPTETTTPAPRLDPESGGAAPHHRPASDRAVVDRSITLSLPLDLRTRFRTHAKATGLTIADALLRAVNDTADQLPRLITDDVAPAPGTGLFHTEGRYHDPTRTVPVPLSVRLRSDNLHVLDRLVVRHGARSRSHLVTLALHAHLDIYVD